MEGRNGINWYGGVTKLTADVTQATLDLREAVGSRNTPATASSRNLQAILRINPGLRSGKFSWKLSVSEYIFM